MSDRDKIIDKIKKCLALSSSSNEHEATAALRQARKLMEAHGVTDLDMQAATASEERTRAGSKARPANWEASLASRIADAFGCRLIFAGRITVGEWIFVGCGAAAEVAKYAFDVLARQARRARAEHIKSKLARCGPTAKTRRADLFSEGWVRAVAGKIEAFASGEAQDAAIAAYVATKYPALGDLAARDRNGDRRLSEREWNDFLAGRRSGSDVTLNRGVGCAGQPLALE